MESTGSAAEIGFKQQEVKFVEWSQEVRARDYDVAYILRAVQAFQQPEVKVLDVGGGIGSVGLVLAKSADNVMVDVVDNSQLAARNFLQHDRLHLINDDFLNVRSDRKYDIIIFRTVLHHIIGATFRQTREFQHEAIRRARDLLSKDGKLLIVENFYDPFVGKDVSGALIYQCTRMKLLAPLFRKLGANTAGEGVRFRSLRSWLEMFRGHGLEMAGDIVMEEWNVSLPLWQGLPFLCRRKYQALLELRRASGVA